MAGICEDSFINDIRRAVSKDDVVRVTKELIAIPSFSGIDRRETKVAEHIKTMFAEFGVPARLTEVTEGRCNVIAEMGSGDALLLAGHLDTVPPYDMVGALSPAVHNGKLYGRGAVDMKGALAAMICAMKAVKTVGLPLLRGVVFAGLIDEEERSEGAVHFVRHEKGFSAAVVGEPTGFNVCTAHRGLEWVEIRVRGKTVHGGAQAAGLNAISAAAGFISFIEEETERAIAQTHHPLIGRGSLNIGAINGGSQPSTVAGDCVIKLDRRWLPGETQREIIGRLEQMAEVFAARVPGLGIDVRIMDESLMAEGFFHEPMETPVDSDIVKAVRSAALNVLGSDAPPTFFQAWSDGGVLSTYGGIPTVVFGPGELALAHSPDEYIELDMLYDAVVAYACIIREYCGTC